MSNFKENLEVEEIKLLKSLLNDKILDLFAFLEYKTDAKLTLSEINQYKNILTKIDNI